MAGRLHDDAVDGKEFEVVKFPFRLKYVSEPLKQLEAVVLEGKYWHDGNKMMTWMMSNVAAQNGSAR